MGDFILNNYLWFKALHIIAVISWMAGLLYLPRLFVYHASAAKGSELSETLKVMERKLLHYIMRPAMIATWVLGLLMLIGNKEALMASGWMHAKLLLVVAMTGIHHVFGAWRKKFARDEMNRPHTFFRWWNEAPTLLMIAIVILAVAKPF